MRHGRQAASSPAPRAPCAHPSSRRLANVPGEAQRPVDQRCRPPRPTSFAHGAATTRRDRPTHPASNHGRRRRTPRPAATGAPSTCASQAQPSTPDGATHAAAASDARPVLQTICEGHTGRQTPCPPSSSGAARHDRASSSSAKMKPSRPVFRSRSLHRTLGYITNTVNDESANECKQRQETNSNIEHFLPAMGRDLYRRSNATGLDLLKVKGHEIE
ncbi:hypothetical protein BS78_K004900 [Paspalum vaginatum]|uniref:Uncharacterized protein n=1 Tax=Paspalum vaginatum TaxID=158149 RepID=A0A9W8CGA8_9POAL|nr:hypothetical protein BS78_K004900 [Paspalum vaginatum]